jgi:hypothetical protein
VHPLARVLDDPSVVTAPPELKSAALDALCFLLRQLRGDFVIFVPLIRKVRNAVVCLFPAFLFMSHAFR